MIAAVLGIALAATSLAGEPTSLPGREAFDYAFRFATAVPDDKDRPKSQEFVIRDLIQVERLEHAKELVPRVQGWRRGVVSAELATALAMHGELEHAKRLVDDAVRIRASVTGWPNPRIAAHIATALVATGEFETAKTVVEGVSVDREYTGRGAAIKAAALAREGKFEEARAALRVLDGVKDIYVSWWRTQGYLELGAEPRLSEQQRRQALDAARASAESVPGWNQAEMLMRVAAAYGENGAAETSREVLRLADEVVSGIGGDSLRLRRASLRASLAREWARGGETARARELLAEAEALAEGSVNSDRAVVFAKIAMAYRSLGDEAATGRLLERAFVVAENQSNPRPRALALAAVCRAVGRESMELDSGLRKRLDGFLKVFNG